MPRSFDWKAAAIVAAIALAGCSSPVQRAANAAALGQQLFAAGQYAAAQAQFDYAVSQRDDVPAVWMARARNQVALHDYPGAFASYRNALDQDRTNREALSAVSQLSLLTGNLDDAKKYAGQMLDLYPGDLDAQMVNANLAFRRDHLDEADKAVQSVLSQQSTYEPALVLRSRILQRRGDLAGATAAILPIFATGGGSADLLTQLGTIYERSADAAGLTRVTQRIYERSGHKTPAALAYAKQLFLVGRPTQAAALLDQTHRADPTGDTRLRTVTLLYDGYVPLAAIAAGLAPLPAPSPSLLTAIGSYAIERGDAAFAEQRLAAAAAADVTPATSDLHGVYALALAKLGRTAEASRAAAAVLAADAHQPAALLARALVEKAAGSLGDALRDARIAVADNLADPLAAAVLADIYAAQGNALLSTKTLADGFNANIDLPAFLKLYTDRLVALGRSGDAVDLARPFTIRNAGSVAGWSIRQALCTVTKDAACARRAATIVARLHGSTNPMPATPPEESLAEQELPRDLTGQ